MRLNDSGISLIKEEHYGCIYKTVNLFNGKLYIGQTTYIENVINNRYKGSGHALWDCINKYGWKNFKSEIIDYGYSQNELNEKEIYYIKEYNTLVPNGYNLTTGGNQIGKHHNETKRKLSEINLGENNPNYGRSYSLSEETKKKMSLSAGKHCKGKSLTEDHKLKISKGTKKALENIEIRNKISEANKGRIPWNKGEEMSNDFKNKIKYQKLIKEKITQCLVKNIQKKLGK